MTDIVERLRDSDGADHLRGCQGRQYSCTCGYNDKVDLLHRDALAEIERLRAVIADAQAAWQPIKTAPKETEVLIRGMAYGKPYSAVARLEDGIWMQFDPMTDSYSVESDGHSHWMPIPVFSLSSAQCG